MSLQWFDTSPWRVAQNVENYGFGHNRLDTTIGTQPLDTSPWRGWRRGPETNDRRRQRTRDVDVDDRSDSRHTRCAPPPRGPCARPSQTSQNRLESVSELLTHSLTQVTHSRTHTHSPRDHSLTRARAPTDKGCRTRSCHTLHLVAEASKQAS